MVVQTRKPPCWMFFFWCHFGTMLDDLPHLRTWREQHLLWPISKFPEFEALPLPSPPCITISPVPKKQTWNIKKIDSLCVQTIWYVLMCSRSNCFEHQTSEVQPPGSRSSHLWRGVSQHPGKTAQQQDQEGQQQQPAEANKNDPVSRGNPATNMEQTGPNVGKHEWNMKKNEKNTSGFMKKWPLWQLWSSSRSLRQT